MTALTFRRVPVALARIPPGEVPVESGPWQEWATAAEPHFFTQSGIVCDERAVPRKIYRETNWRGYKIVIPADDLTGAARAFSSLPDALFGRGLQSSFVHPRPDASVYLFVRGSPERIEQALLELGHSIAADQARAVSTQ